MDRPRQDSGASDTSRHRQDSNTSIPCRLRQDSNASSRSGTRRDSDASVFSKPRQDSSASVPSSCDSRSSASSITLPSIGTAVPEIKDGGFPPPSSQTKKRQSLPPLLPSKFYLPPNAIIRIDGKVLKEYNVDGYTYTMAEAQNETVSWAERRTVGGRKLTYELTVIQQPTRARACGSGPRSSADRRPVDPPPVAQLKVWEWEGEQKRDITHNYDATFVLYASLELARPIAGARMFNHAIAPVLTGVPVAGTAYLDKPTPAAYFIFPDLSVRHEGWYNLRFCLFEGIKKEEDADPEQPLMPAINSNLAGQGKPSPWDGMINRMEVRSTKFQVFSAKKFPGLKGSTDLSRLIADQGCRVRIRREVRQRKRVDKGGDPASDDEDDPHSQLRATPETAYHTPTPSDHARSISRNSHDDSAYHGDQYRRFSTDSGYAQNTLPPLRPPQSPHDHHAQTSYPSMPPPSSIAATYTMPPPQSLINQRPQEPSPYMAPYHNMSVPRTQSVGSSPQDKTLPPLSSMASFDTSRRLYDIPQSTQPLKRSYSPHSNYNQSGAMKAGARPDTLLAPQPQRELHEFGNGWSQGAMEAGDDDDDASDSDDSLLEGTYTYKRADGSRGNKVTAHLTQYRGRF